MPPSPRAARLYLLALLLLVAVAPALAVTGNGRLQVIHLDVEQGDGAVLITPLGQVALIDNGPGGSSNAIGRTVAQQLTALGITHIDHVFTSHYHSDHFGGIDELGPAGISFDYAWDRGGSYSSSYYTTYVNTVGIKRRTLVKDQVITLDSLSAHPVAIKCVNLNGAGIATTDENALSVVLKVSYGEYDESFGGDIAGVNSGSYKNVESTVAPQMGVIEVMKVHHHGSATSTYTTWLQTTQPKIGIISCGNGNSYGHPTLSALSRLHTQGTHTYWTETGAGATPDPNYDRAVNGQIIIQAVWQGGGVDTVRGTGFADTFTNSGSGGDAIPPVVALTSPDGGETWKAGSSHTVTWTASDNVGVTAVDLAYSTDGGATFPYAIATGLGNSGSCFWTVPDVVTATARVRAVARDAAANQGRDSSAANFTIDKWLIAASAGSGGSIVPAGSVPVLHGASQHFSIAPAPGHHVATLAIDGGGVMADTTYTFTNVTAAHTIAATFEADAYTVTATAVGGGSVSVTPEQPTYAYGETVEVDAAPDSGWAFVGWSGDTSGTDDPVTLTVTGDRTVTATFHDVALPLVDLLAPEGGEHWEAGMTMSVRWSAMDNAGVDSVRVDYTVTGPGGPWLPIAHGAPNSGSVGWTLPEQTADSARVRVIVYDVGGNTATDMSAGTFLIEEPGPAAVESGPATLALSRPRPNPSRGSVGLRFSLPAPGHARIEVLDLSGRRMMLAEGEWPAGPSLVRWDADARAPAGLYFVRLSTAWGTRSERLVRLD